VGLAVQGDMLEELMAPALVELELGRIALHAVLVVEAEAMVRCRMSALDRVNTYRRPRTSTSVLGEISTSCGRGEISLALSRVAVF